MNQIGYYHGMVRTILTAKRSLAHPGMVSRCAEVQSSPDTRQILKILNFVSTTSTGIREIPPIPVQPIGCMSNRRPPGQKGLNERTSGRAIRTADGAILVDHRLMPDKAQPSGAGALDCLADVDLATDPLGVADKLPTAPDARAPS